jgi:glutathione S-transferase
VAALEDTMKIYWIKAQAPRRVLALVKHLGVQVELTQLTGASLKAADYLALNPNGKAPTLVDGDTVLWEASAIMAYLSIKAGSDMWPVKNPYEQVEVLRWLSWNDCHWIRAVGPFYFEHVVKAEFGLGSPDSASLKAHTPELTRLASILDAHLAGKEFVACGRLTIADFQLASMATYWRDAEVPFAAFPNVVRWLDRLDRIPAWANPWPASA